MRRMGGLDAAFLYGETPSWHMHVSAVMLIDPATTPGGWSFEKFKAHVASRLPHAPQFRWRPVEVPFGLGRPGWVESPDFDIDFHVRRIGCPTPGTKRELGDLVGEIASWKIDRRHPLWEMWVIDGLESGELALLAKVHHSIVDGVSGVELATILLDMNPEPSPPPEGTAESLLGERVPGNVELFARGVLDTALTPLRAIRYSRQLVEQGLAFVPFARRKRPPVLPFQAPRVSWNAEITPHRRFACSTLPLPAVRELGKRYEVKVNDVVLALCAGTLRRYLIANDELPSAPLVAQVPVSVRGEEDRAEVGNKVAAMFASLATDIEDPAERIRAIHESTSSAKEMQRALAAKKIMGLTDTTPPGLIALAARTYSALGLDARTPPIFNVIISNVPGPQFPLYIAGARLEALWPMGPLLYGGGLNITVFSYCDEIGFGFMACRETVSDPWFIADGIQVALDELTAAAP